MSQDDLEPLPLDLQRLLREGRPGDEPPPGSRDAVLSFVALHAGALGAASLVHGAAHATQATAAGRGAFGRALFALRGSVGIGGLVIGAAVGTGVGAAGHAALVGRHGDAAHVVAAASPTLLADAPSTLPSANVPMEPPSVSLESLPRVAVPVVAPSQAPPPAVSGDVPNHVKDSSNHLEATLIDMARTAVARRQGDEALAALQRHEREFPHGRLSEDREWLWIQALLLTDQTDAARERASRFRRSFPRSFLLPELDQRLPAPSSPTP